MLDIATFIWENWPPKLQNYVAICADIQNHHAAAWVPKTLNCDPHLSMCLLSLVVLFCMFQFFRLRFLLPGVRVLTGVFFLSDYLMLSKRKCWWTKSGCWLSFKREHICILLTCCCWLKALMGMTQDPGFSTPTLASLANFFPKWNLMMCEIVF